MIELNCCTLISYSGVSHFIDKFRNTCASLAFVRELPRFENSRNVEMKRYVRTSQKGASEDKKTAD